MTKLTNNLTKIGRGLMQQENGPLKMKFCKGYTRDGFAEKVYHLHVGYAGDWDELYFRNYLIAYPDAAKVESIEKI